MRKIAGVVLGFVDEGGDGKYFANNTECQPDYHDSARSIAEKGHVCDGDYIDPDYSLSQELRAKRAAVEARNLAIETAAYGT